MTGKAVGQRLRGGLVVAEIALTLVLLAGAGLLMKSFWILRRVDPGFDSRNVLTLRISLDGYKYKTPAEWAEWFRRLQEHLETIPGARSASVVMPVPLNGLKIFDDFTFPFEIEGRPMERSERPRIGGYGMIQPGYFHTMGIPLVAGRDFTARDNAGAPAVVIINERFARRYFPGENALGKRLRIGPPLEGKRSPVREIVGIAGDVKSSRLDAGVHPQVYTPHAQDPFNEMYVALKTETDPHGFVSAVRAKALALDRHQAFYDVRTLDERRDASVAQQRFSMLLFAIFASVALILTAVGLYGVIAYSVTQRTREIGIRMALGAQSSDVLKLVIGQAMVLVFAGAVAGLGAALALTRTMRSLLFGVSGTDPVTFSVILLLLALVALVAAWMPARRAATVDPLISLKYE